MPLVQVLFELYKLLHEYIKLFPKPDRYSLGQKLETTALDLLEILLTAASLPKYQKGRVLKQASIKFDLLKYLTRLAYDIKVINVKRYVIIIEKFALIGKMLGGWIKSLN